MVMAESQMSDPIISGQVDGIAGLGTRLCSFTELSNAISPIKIGSQELSGRGAAVRRRPRPLAIRIPETHVLRESGFAGEVCRVEDPTLKGSANFSNS